MLLNRLRYLAILLAPILGFLSLHYNGWYVWLLPAYAFVFIPLVELVLTGTTYNFTPEEEEAAKNDKYYDYLLYAMVPVQYVLLFYFFTVIGNPELTSMEFVGKIMAMGLGCVGLGINVAHELGHRAKKSEQIMSQMLLLTTLYMHFFIEHNRGHHKRVATEEDPASARYGEVVYLFWIRSVVFSYLSAWELEAKRLKKRGLSVFSIHNQMIWFQIIQISAVVSVGYFFGLTVMLAFIASAVLGFLFLETVNYIEHYGLRRKQNEENRYVKVLPCHSWNSNHSFGRVMLFEVTRHSDHHYRASRKYQILRHFDEAPQMPYGYPVMIILALFPPVWFAIMHRRIEEYKAQHPELATAMG